MNRKIEKVTLENVGILGGTFRNFSGNPDRYNPDGGKRYFNIEIPDAELADTMLNDGWNVKTRQPDDEYENELRFMKINVKYNDYPPKIYRVSNITGRRVLLDDLTVGELDHSKILSADLTISPFTNWGDGDMASAYVTTMYVTVDDDPLAAKYED